MAHLIIGAGSELTHSDIGIEQITIYLHTSIYRSGLAPVNAFRLAFPNWHVFLSEQVYGIVFHYLPVKECHDQGDFWV